MIAPIQRYSRQLAWRKRNLWIRYLEYARRRCTDPNHESYPCYGGKGVRVLLAGEEIKVLWDRDCAAGMCKPSLDHIDSAGDYTFANCRFIEHRLNSRLAYVEDAACPF